MPITVGTRVRDIKTRLEGRVIRICAEVRPHTDLVVIRLDKPDPVYGSVTSAYDCEVEVVKQESGQDKAAELCGCPKSALATRLGTAGREN